jgi:hypothetical protein
MSYRMFQDLKSVLQDLILEVILSQRHYIGVGLICVVIYMKWNEVDKTMHPLFE